MGGHDGRVYRRMLVDVPVRNGVSRRKRALGAGGRALALALGLAGGPVAAQIQVVSAGGEYETFHPRPVAARTGAGGGDFQAAMDRAFGAGRWRKTSGYRTQAQENALRRQGARGDPFAARLVEDEVLVRHAALARPPRGRPA